MNVVQDYPIYIYRGAAFTDVWQYVNAAGVPIDCTGYTARLNIYTHKGGRLIASLFSGTGEITVTPLTGTFAANWDELLTGAIDFDGGWSEFLITAPDGTLIPLTQGSVTFDGIKR